MKIGIIYMAYGEKFKADIKYGRITLIDYCKRYGYDFIEDESLAKEHDREIQWTKILLIQKYIQSESPKYDYLVWIDADTLIMNPEIRIEDFISRLMNNRDIMYSNDFHGWINNGIIFIKNTPISLEYFKEVWNHTGEICREQGAMDLLYRMNWNNCRNFVQVTLDLREYNSLWHTYEWDQFLLHFPGCGEPNRLPNSLKRMMDIFTPIRMKEDTDDSFINRMKWLREKAGDEMRYKKQLCNQQGWKYLPIDLE